MRLAVLVLLAGCDVLFRIDPAPTGDGRTDGSRGGRADAAPIVPIGFVQSGTSTSTAPDPYLVATYLQPQTAGDLNVVIVGGPNALTVAMITDQAGNTYRSATLPLRTGIVAQSLFYAENIKGSAGGNQVTITLTGPATGVDARILEYSGIAAAASLDGIMGMVGTSSTMMNSGLLTTTNAHDLLVGGGTVGSVTSGAGAGYAWRKGDFELAEDMVVQTVGDYAATGTQKNATDWVMQIAAFKGF